MMAKKWLFGCMAPLALAAALLAGCKGSAPAAQSAPGPAVSAASDAGFGAVAGSSEMAAVQPVGQGSLAPVYAASLRDGVYNVAVDSSSAMFRVTAATLTVQSGSMALCMTMGGTGYLYVYPGTAAQAAAAPQSAYIPYVQQADGAHSFTVPLQALDQGFACAAFSKNKQKWYERTLLVRAASLPAEAWAEGSLATAQSLALADGVYMAEAVLEGGSGRAGVQSPARVTVTGGKATVQLVWSSDNYDYMLVDGVRYQAAYQNGRSVFEIPLPYFDAPFAVVADTVAMSTPHEIEYALCLASHSLAAAGQEAG